MNFAKSLERLRAAASERQRGISPGNAVVRQYDLAELLHQFDTIDGAARHSIAGMQQQIEAVAAQRLKAETRLAKAMEVVAVVADFGQFVDTNDGHDEKYSFLLRAGVIRAAAECKKEYE